MKLLNLSKRFLLFIFFLLFSLTLFGEEKIDIWNKENFEKNNENITKEKPLSEENKIKIDVKSNLSNESKIEISDEIKNTQESFAVSGIYDPEENDLSLNIWSKSDGNDIKEIMKRN